MGTGGDNQTRYYINKTVDGNMLSAVLKGLMPGVLYQVEVAAVTSVGVGARSQPVSVVISESTLTEKVLWDKIQASTDVFCDPDCPKM